MTFRTLLSVHYIQCRYGRLSQVKGSHAFSSWCFHSHEGTLKKGLWRRIIQKWEQVTWRKGRKEQKSIHGTLWIWELVTAGFKVCLGSLPGARSASELNLSSLTFKVNFNMNVKSLLQGKGCVLMRLWACVSPHTEQGPRLKDGVA